ncbi:hypothetical protein EHQ61_07065 [Leptospira wolffii]|uniref:hypothetical protein n=1 Tax=Leptospira wolffii TaxID=409998 RepID=UPI0010836AC4|nr:hypothetical protein [Leptospira wolffii]TGL51973.1 hypothetical protein EHQ61_07065 [Leptospira wolffii]
MTDHRKPWIFSARFDLAWILGPGILSVILVLIADYFDFPNAGSSSGASRTDGKALPPWLWLALIPGIDVAHVYSTLFRAYWDREVWNRRKTLLTLTPLFCFISALILYSFGKSVFWTCVSYLAVFHFIRQQYGFLSLYARGEKRTQGLLSFSWDKATLYAITILPVVYWHLAPGGRKFEWFTEGDFFYFPQKSLAELTILFFWTWVVIYAFSQIYLLIRKEYISIGKLLLLFNTASVWYVGIVLLNDDFAFTFTNVINHGIPYIALIYAYGNFRRKNLPHFFYTAFSKGLLAILPFVGVLLLLAYSEEWLWDTFVWREHAEIFGNRSVSVLEIGRGFEFILVPMFFLPQFTHYILDGFLWKGGKENEELVGFLNRPKS